MMQPKEETSPLVSFIVTCYNLPVSMLQECLDSILAIALTPEEREIIIIDDGSDVSPVNELTEAYGDDILYIRQRNEGVSSARNRGLATAKGRFVQFVDGDDRLMKNAYNHCLDILRNKDTDLLMFDFTSQQGNQTTFEDMGPYTGTAFMQEHNIHGAAWSYVMRRSAVGNLQFTKGVKYTEDEEFTAQLMLRSEVFYHTTAQAYFYRRHRNAVTQQRTPESAERRLGDQMHTLLALQSSIDRLPPSERQAMQRRIAQLTMDHIYNTIMLTRSGKQLECCIQKLTFHGLFPLPDRHYTRKYTWFRRLTTTRGGRRILLHILPFTRKE